MDKMIVHHASGLHERIDDGRADKIEAFPLQGFGHGLGLIGEHGHVLKGCPLVLHGLAANKGPQEIAEGFAVCG